MPTIPQRIAGLDLDPEVARTLLQVSRDDTARLATLPHLAPLFPALGAALGHDPESIAGFRAAWLLLYAAISRLDHLQDNDPMEHPLPAVGAVGAQYNLVLAMYVLANSLLDELASAVPASRLIRLYRLWNDLVLRMAHGQQRDLQLGTTALSGGAADLDAYQQIAQDKTGATFALAFGGTAILLTDDAATIATLTAVGESYGTLIQYGDDLRDAAQQPTHAATLPAVLRRLPHFADPSQQHLHAFWSYALTTSVAAVQERLAEHPARMQTHISALFTQVFELPTRPSP
ncbi:MAG: class 1 isoprenoid biosynthesis enzyme [Blastochloris sp.]|nr:class 1 isoprenoid biosynthesis enzyme [Blastochloris sp.]